MRIRLIAIGTRMPDWVNQGFADYASRLPKQCALELEQIRPGRRTRAAPPERAVAEEGQRMLAAVRPSERVIAMDVKGKGLTSEDWARRLQDWMQGGSDIALLVGGPDGLPGDCLARSESVWSLSQLTMPHGLVRVVIAEQLYRAWSLLSNHPYHRA